jgi:hypothetical protein
LSNAIAHTCAYRPKLMSKDTALSKDSRYTIWVACICGTKEEKEELYSKNDDDNDEEEAAYEDEDADADAVVLKKKRKYSSNDNEEKASISDLGSVNVADLIELHSDIVDVESFTTLTGSSSLTNTSAEAAIILLGLLGQRVSSNVTKTNRHRQDSNLRGMNPIDF